jgi:hypothetical protein
LPECVNDDPVDVSSRLSFQDTSACAPCLQTCGAGMYMNATCAAGNGTSDTVQCAACDPCPPYTYDAIPCPGNGTSPAREDLGAACPPCKLCAAGEYIASGATCSASYTDCRPCRICGEGEYATAPCDGAGTTAEQLCKRCDEGGVACPVGFFFNSTGVSCACQPCIPGGCPAGDGGEEYYVAGCPGNGTSPAGATCEQCEPCGGGNGMYMAPGSCSFGGVRECLECACPGDYRAGGPCEGMPGCLQSTPSVPATSSTPSSTPTPTPSPPSSTPVVTPTPSTTTATATTTTPPPPPSSSSSSSGQLGTGAIAGIAVGASVAAIVGGVAVYAAVTGASVGAVGSQLLSAVGLTGTMGARAPNYSSSYGRGGGLASVAKWRAESRRDVIDNLFFRGVPIEPPHTTTTTTADFAAATSLSSSSFPGRPGGSGSRPRHDMRHYLQWSEAQPPHESQQNRRVSV